MSDETPPEPAAPRRHEPAPVPFLRRVNQLLGHVEHLLVAGFLAALILTATVQAIASIAFNRGIEGSDEIIRYMVFFIAMSAAALAAQRARMIGMDVVTRLLSGRARAALRLLVTALVVVIAYLVARVVLELRTSESDLAQGFVYISRGAALLAVPIGMALIAFHYLLASAIDLAYLLRGMEPPEEEAAPVH